MKLWEAIRELTEDPTKVATSKLTEKGLEVKLMVGKGSPKYFEFHVFNGQRLINQNLGGGAFNGNVALEMDWEVEKQPVTWQEAIQRWAAGKTVSVEVGGCRYNLTHDDSIFGLSERMVNLGVWYVEGEK